MADMINHPPHYMGFTDGAKVIDITEHLEFLPGNVVKYVCRAGKKNGSPILDDIDKALWYLKRWRNKVADQVERPSRLDALRKELRNLETSIVVTTEEIRIESAKENNNAGE